jgi:hypothetical protein
LRHRIGTDAPRHTNEQGSGPKNNMSKLTLAQLERHLFGAADILRGKMV